MSRTSGEKEALRAATHPDARRPAGCETKASRPAVAGLLAKTTSVCPWRRPSRPVAETNCFLIGVSRPRAVPFVVTGRKQTTVDAARKHQFAPAQSERRMRAIEDVLRGEARVARALAWLERYLKEVRPRLCLDTRTPALFLTGYGDAFNPDVVSRMVSGWLKQAGLKRKGCCHTLRHSCATHMLENGADIRFIQQLLGHEKRDTTAIYTEVSIKQLQEVHARCHPSAKQAIESKPEPSYVEHRADNTGTNR